jgi:hypothetical protein
MVMEGNITYFQSYYGRIVVVAGGICIAIELPIE